MMQLFSVLLLLGNVMIINAAGAPGGQTKYDASWTRQCEAGQHISHVSSSHSNRHEDRTWTFYCRKDRKITKSCSWTNWVNGFDHEILYQCRNGVITGVRSYHSNHYEDRRFRFKCCLIKNNCLRDCYWTGYVNNWDGYMNYYVSLGRYLVGFKSHHDNRREDRRWRFLICRQS